MGDLTVHTLTERLDRVERNEETIMSLRIILALIAAFGLGVLVTLSMLGSSAVNAEPTPSVRWLMNEPASLFDIGMMRIRQDNLTHWIPTLMDKIKDKGLKLDPQHGGGVFYNFRDNEIGVEVSLIGPRTESLCAEVLQKYKDVIAPGKMSSEFTFSSLGSYFDHINYSTQRRPKNLNQNLIGIMTFTASISDTPGLGGNAIFCKSKLFDETPSFKKYGR